MTDFVLPKERLAEIRSAASATEREMLADGILTFAEYERAIFATIGCMQQAGLIIAHFDHFIRFDLDATRPGPKLTKRGKYLYSAGAPEAASPDMLGSTVRRCEDEFSTVIRFMWTEHTSLSEQEWQQVRDTLAMCIGSSGHEVSEHPSQAELDVLLYPPNGIPGPGVSAPVWYWECASAAFDEFEIG